MFDGVNHKLVRRVDSALVKLGWTIKHRGKAGSKSLLKFWLGKLESYCHEFDGVPVIGPYVHYARQKLIESGVSLSKAKFELYRSSLPYWYR